MTAASRFDRSRLTGALRAGAAACAILAALSAPALAQSPLQDIDVPQNERMLLVANELTYSNSTDVVTATGGVQIDYGDYKLVADRVEYNQRTGQVRAIGKVELVEPDGNRIFADNLDITDDFADGFVNGLKIVTPDKTYIAAESAERRAGVETTFNNGVYTACAPCEENPEKPPIWQVKARRVVEDSRTNRLKLYNASFELFGHPIAHLPYFEMPSDKAKRATGFLTPSFGSTDELGAWLRVPYFITLGPSADVTVSGTGYTRQGFLMEAEFRKQFENGRVTLKMAGISQSSPERFEADTVDRLEDNRGLIGTTGKFQINPRWTFGWDAMIETDPNFARTYGIEGFDDTKQESEIYLTGIGSRSYFDLHAYRFDIRRKEVFAGGPYAGEYYAEVLEDREAVVHPVLDYNKVFSKPIAGGELSLDVNGQAISRELDNIPIAPVGTTPGRYAGLEGHNERLTAELEWRRTFTTSGGLRLTPILAARGDLHSFKTSTVVASLAPDDSASRGMVTAGLEASYPILATTSNSSHVFEPIAQIFVRPDERLAGGLPNEDAQSFVFDAASLFERDKFSGYDRVEGGTRANVGFRYTGTFNNGITTQAIFGQSYHIAGLNSFAAGDLVSAGIDSGLDQDVSDFVSRASVTFPNGFSLGAGARFDKDSFEVMRGDVSAGIVLGNLTGRITYTEIKAQPGYGSHVAYGGDEDRSGILGSASLRVAENWRVFGSSGYDFGKDEFSTSVVGFAYEDECVALTLSYKRLPDYTTETTKWSVGARLSLRTLGDFNYGSATGKTF